jgi:hypothetical protein
MQVCTSIRRNRLPGQWGAATVLRFVDGASSGIGLHLFLFVRARSCRHADLRVFDTANTTVLYPILQRPGHVLRELCTVELCVGILDKYVEETMYLESQMFSCFAIICKCSNRSFRALSNTKMKLSDV